ncbi:acetolactate synthase-1/2/3 large subunit [Paraburkholderia sp. BL6669N2]|uniref:thiamine pyrophosphate-binding protein n=1 Tax=Paraburkholderia sp. BL6669N2 TaxID=1938807 RepID=UPI000E26E294|nr:thiamine pyrophosphate-binding protein [Paraburkholderia sp. BL6669N2]REG60830.1 acetolactate synthase-1/2/3 large subunit [Paraburkholderia sp. BL6669N2]
MKLSGGQVIAKELRAYGVRYVAGVPGNGNSAVLEGLNAPGASIPFIRVVNEQSAVHMADGYFRACGSAMAVVLPSRTGIYTASAALSNCLSDSCGVLLITGDQGSGDAPAGSTRSTRTGRGWDADSACSGLKRSWKVCGFSELPQAMHRAFNSALGARPGPVHLEVPFELQTHTEHVSSESPQNRLTQGRLRGDPAVIELAASLLANAERPIILAGGGVVAADAISELNALADALSAPVLVAGNGIGVIPHDHDLNAGSVGAEASQWGTALLSKADVIVAVGSRLSDLHDIYGSASGISEVAGKKLIQIDVERDEIGKRYPVEVGIVADAKSALVDLNAAMNGKLKRATGARRQAFIELMRQLREQWRNEVASRSGASETFIRPPRPFLELRKVLHRDAIAVIGSGAVVHIAREHFPVYAPRTFLSPGASAAGGWAVPAAIGAKLAMPARQVVCVVEDSDFLQSMQEMAVSVMHCIPVVFVVFNRSGPEFVSGAIGSLGARPSIGEFCLPDGRPYPLAFSEIARSFGLDAWRVEHASQLEGAFRRALDSTGPALVEVMVARHENDAATRYEDVQNRAMQQDSLV